MRAIVIAGGGIAGLSAAWELERILNEPSESDDETQIVLFEAGETVGGKLKSNRVDGFLLDFGPDGFLARKPAGIELCRELGIEHALVDPLPQAVRSFVRRGSELFPLPAGFSGLVPSDLEALGSTPILTVAGRARALAEGEQPPRADTSDESVAGFFTRRYGREAFERMIEPLVTGIFAGDAERLGMRAAFPHLREMELAYGSLSAGSARRLDTAAAKSARSFVSFPAGMETLARALSARLTRTEIRTSETVAAVERAGDALRVRCRDGSAIDADALIIAVPAWSAAELVRAVDAAMADDLAAIRYAESTIVHLGYRLGDVCVDRAGHGYVIPAVEESMFRACTVTSRKWPGRAPSGYDIVRLYARGGASGSNLDHRSAAAAENELVGAAIEEVAKVIGASFAPVLTHVRRWARSIPQYDVGYLDRIARIDRRAAFCRESGVNIALCGAAYRGVGIPDCIASGRDAARVVSGEAARLRTRRDGAGQDGEEPQPDSR